MTTPPNVDASDPIAAAIPHRPPMLLIDEIVARDESSILCRKTFRADEFFVQGHFPGNPLVPGVILCEAAMQAGAILAAGRGGAAAGSVPVATRLDGVKFKQMVRPGETIDIAVTLTEALGNAFFMTGKITTAGRLAARLDFACAMTESEEKKREGGTNSVGGE